MSACQPAAAPFVASLTSPRRRRSCCSCCRPPIEEPPKSSTTEDSWHTDMACDSPAKRNGLDDERVARPHVPEPNIPAGSHDWRKCHQAGSCACLRCLSPPPPPPPVTATPPSATSAHARPPRFRPRSGTPLPWRGLRSELVLCGRIRAGWRVGAQGCGVSRRSLPALARPRMRVVDHQARWAAKQAAYKPRSFKDREMKQCVARGRGDGPAWQMPTPSGPSDARRPRRSTGILIPAARPCNHAAAWLATQDLRGGVHSARDPAAPTAGRVGRAVRAGPGRVAGGADPAGPLPDARDLRRGRRRASRVWRVPCAVRGLRA